MTADEEIHEHYNELLRGADTIIWGRTTYQLMEDYWPSVVGAPTGNKPIDDFAVLVDNICKIVYSRSLKSVGWKNAGLKREVSKEEIVQLKQKAGKDIIVGSPSMILEFGQRGLVDEYQLSVHPTVVGNGLSLFRNIKDRIDLKLLKTKTFGCGAVTLYYEPASTSAL
jgi:dihydrofolate reductase